MVIYLYPNGATKYLLRRTGEALVLGAGEQLADCPDGVLRCRIEQALPDAERIQITEPLPVYPDLAHVHLTRACNLNCEHCYVEGGKDSETMAFSEACGIVDTLAEIGVDTIAFGGGEVSLVRYFPQLVEHTIQRGITPTYTTNGLQLDIETAQRCGAVSVSVDGIGEDYAIQRGCRFGVWEQIEASIQTLADVHPNAIANILVTRRNCQKLFPIAKHLCQLGIRQFLFLRFKPEGRGRFRDKSLRPNEVQMVVGQLLAISLWPDVRVQLDACSIPYFRATNLPKVILHRLGSQLDGDCGAGRSFLCIDPGLVVKACSFQNGSFLSLREYAFAECWEAVVAWNAAQRRFPPKKCAHCEFYEWCGGGCPLLKNESETVDSFCSSELPLESR